MMTKQKALDFLRELPKSHVAVCWLLPDGSVMAVIRFDDGTFMSHCFPQ